jgi:hypothetical protein
MLEIGEDATKSGYFLVLRLERFHWFLGNFLIGWGLLTNRKIVGKNKKQVFYFKYYIKHASFLPATFPSQDQCKFRRKGTGTWNSRTLYQGTSIRVAT